MKRMIFSLRMQMLTGLVAAGLFLNVDVRSQDDIFPVPPDLQTDGVPVLSRSDVTKALVDPATVGANLIWDADATNRRLLVTDSANRVLLLETPLSDPRPVIDKIVPESARFRPKTRDFAFLSDYEDEDNYHIYLYDDAAGTSRALTRKSGDDTIASMVWGQDGSKIYYVRVDYEKKTSRVCFSDLKTETCVGEELKGNWEAVSVSGRKLILKFWNSSSNQQLFIFNIDEKGPQPLETVGNSRRAGLSGDEAYWLNEGSPLCPDHPCLLYRRLGKGKTLAVSLPNGVDSIQDFKLSPTGRYAMLLEVKDGIDRIHVLELRGDKVVREMPQFVESSLVIWHTKWLGDSELAFTTEHVGKPASIHSFDFKTKRATTWTRERMPDSLAGKIALPEPIKWKSFDGKQIPGYIVRPANSKGPLPVLIFVHGGPLVLDRPIFSASESALVSALNIAVIHTNVRGSSGMGRDYMEADDGEKRAKVIDDVRSLIDWVQTRPDLDGKRIALRGQSYGGWVVLGTALAEPDRVKAVVAEFPLVSIRGMVSMSWADDAVFAEYGNPKDEQLMKKLDALSPLNNAGKWNRIPLLLTRGKRDERSPENDVKDLRDQLRAAGANVWWIYSLDAGHGFGGQYVNAALYRFLKEKL